MPWWSCFGAALGPYVHGRRKKPRPPLDIRRRKKPRPPLDIRRQAATMRCKRLTPPRCGVGKDRQATRSPALVCRRGRPPQTPIMTTDLYILAFAPAERVEPLPGFLTPKRMAGIMRAYMIDSSLRLGVVLTDAVWSA